MRRSLIVLALLAAPLSALAQDAMDESSGATRQIVYFEGYVGLTAEQLRATLGEPVSTSVESAGVAEREATLWFYDAQTPNGDVLTWRFALQHKRVVGAELVSTHEPEALYAAARWHVEAKGSSWVPGGPLEENLSARTGQRFWEVGFMQSDGERAVRVEIGTFKYQTCRLNWDAEGLRGTDGFGNPIAENADDQTEDEAER